MANVIIFLYTYIYFFSKPVTVLDCLVRIRSCQLALRYPYIIKSELSMIHVLYAVYVAVIIMCVFVCDRDRFVCLRQPSFVHTIAH